MTVHFMLEGGPYDGMWQTMEVDDPPVELRLPSDRSNVAALYRRVGFEKMDVPARGYSAHYRFVGTVDSAPSLIREAPSG